jgi:hypothetical protein
LLIPQFKAEFAIKLVAALFAEKTLGGSFSMLREHQTEPELEELAADAVRICFFRLLTITKTAAKPANVAMKAYRKCYPLSLKYPFARDPKPQDSINKTICKGLDHHARARWETLERP